MKKNSALFRIKLGLYYILVGRNELIRKEYQAFAERRKFQSCLTSVKEIIRLNIKYTVLRHDPRKNYRRLKYPETGSRKRPDKAVILTEALKADIVSFDLFDTLLLRVFDTPEDLFILLGNVLGIADFRNLRKRAEQEARCRSTKKNDEINIWDIYAVLEQWCSIPCGEGVEKEFLLEQQFCFANPYMKEIFEQLKKHGKRMIIASDMYLTADLLDRLLRHCGIRGYEKIYVSCDCGCSKSDGGLQKYIAGRIGSRFSYYHIGDNDAADIRQSWKSGWQTGYYRKVGECGRDYRPCGMSRLTGSVYKGLVNAWFYAAGAERTVFYEYGFTCGGIMAAGFCKWLNRMAKAEGIDKFFFVARDGDILSRVYGKYFKTIDYEYVQFSRMASEQLIFGDFTEEYIRHAVLPEIHDAGNRFTLPELLDFCGIGALQTRLCDGAFERDQVLLAEDYEAVRRILYSHKEDIQKEFESASCSARKYFTKLAGKSRKICVVDIGWRGTSVQYLKFLLEKKYNLGVQISGALLGAGMESYAEGLLAEGMIRSYLFSQADHCGISKQICFSKNNRLCMEMLFSSEQPTLLQYGADDSGETCFIHKKKNEVQEEIRQIQSGIMDFVDWYFERMGAYAYSLDISPEDAAAPVLAVLQNKVFVKDLTAGCRERGDSLRHGFDQKDNRNEEKG